MANLAKIQSIAQGQFFVKDSLGNLTELKVGDTVSLNDTIVAASSNTDLSKIEILFDTNELITLSQGEQLLDATLLASTFGNEELAFDKQEVDETLNAWNNAQDGDETDMETAAGDVTEQATNAGDERAADGGALRSKFNSRDGSSTDVRSDLRDGDFDGENPETPQEQIPTELLNPTAVAGVTPTTPTPVAPDASAVGAVVVNEAGLNNDEDNSEIAEVRVDGYTIVGGGTGTYGNIDFVDGKWVYTLTYRFEHTGEGTDTAEDADTVTITVQDAQGNTFTVEVNVNIVDDVPTITVETPATGAYGSEITGKVAIEFGADGEKSITVKINDGTEVQGVKGTDGNYTFDMGAGKTVELNGATGEFTYNGVPTSGSGATYEFEFIVTDSDGDTATATTTATVVATNLDGLTAAVTSSDTDVANNKDADNSNDLVHTVTLNGLPSGATLVAGTYSNTNGYGEIEVANGTATYKQTGVYSHTDITKADTQDDAETIELTVKLADGTEVKVPVKVNIIDDVPTITVETPATGAYGSEITGKVAIEFGADGEKSITVKINDGTEVQGVKGTDGNYTFDMGAGKTVELNGATGEFTYNGVPTSGSGATYEFEFIVTDSDGDTATATTTATVAAKLPLIKIYGNDVSEEQSGTSTGNKVVGTITAEITNGVIPSKDIVIDLGNGKIITIPAGSTTGIASTEVDTTRVDDYYDQGETTENFEGTIISGNALFVDGTTISTATVTINDDKDPTGVTLNATIIKTSTITKDNLENNLSFKVTALDGEGKSATVSKNHHVEHSGFGVLSSNETDNGKVDQNYSGDPKELGIDSQGRSEKIIIEFNNEVKSMDVSFAWRATQEEARVDFYDGDTHVGYAIVSGGGNDTEATVIYYKPNGDVLKTVNAPGGTDKVDLSYTFEPGDGTVFNKVEFTAVDNGKVTGLQSDYLIHSITYQEVVQGNSLDKGEKAEVLLEVQTEYKPDPKTFDPANPPIAKVDVNGTIHDVKLDENGYGTLELTTDGNTDLVAKVTEIIGGNYEKVDLNTTENNSKIIVNDTPDTTTVTTIDETSNITVNKDEKTNLVLTIDVSGSMVRTNVGSGKGSMNAEGKPSTNGSYDKVDLDGKGTTRFDVLKQSMISTIETYKAGGNTKVNMTLFAGNAKNLGWMSADEAINYLSKLTMGTDAVVKYDGKELDVNTGSTNYVDAMKDTRDVFDIKKGKEADFIVGAKNVAYFISDGMPNKKETYILDQNSTSMTKWKTFLENNSVDLKVIAVGTAEDNSEALKYLESLQVTNSDVIVINEPSSIETVILGTIEGTVFGDVTDNFFGGDGKVTIDSIEVGNQTYTKDTMPKGGLKLDGEGKLLFDFETGKYAYNGNGADITEDKTKSFQVNVSDQNGDKGTVNVNFELNKEQIDGVINFKESGDINFSNLENIVNLKEINLDNGKDNKLSLTLDDVLKLSGDDGKIKITGDQFDSVAFKDDGWKKSDPIVDTESGTQVVEWTNTRDESVSVKVEQPISDGITS
ncbi:VCBS domain-containing protein [Aliarcobacter cryaerophilus]|uniref:VCBS domain-containing protein n=1 Tax=Aliarcobacter cryaerophilus TaxID=28198 RepID=UPI003DA38C69